MFALVVRERGFPVAVDDDCERGLEAVGGDAVGLVVVVVVASAVAGEERVPRGTRERELRLDLGRELAVTPGHGDAPDVERLAGRRRCRGRRRRLVVGGTLVDRDGDVLEVVHLAEVLDLAGPRPPAGGGRRGLCFFFRHAQPRVEVVLDRVGDGAVGLEHAREVEEEAVRLALAGPEPAAGHLDVEAPRARRAGQDDRRAIGHVEALGDDLAIADDADVAVAKLRDDLRSVRRLGRAVDVGRRDAPPPERRLERFRVLDVDAEGDAAAVAEVRRDVVGDALARDLRRERQGARVEVARRPQNLDARRRDDRPDEEPRRHQVAVAHELAHRGPLDELVEDVRQTRPVEPVRRRRHAERRRVGRELLEEQPVRRRRRVVRLVDDDAVEHGG
mmetsp:Transcript_8819/g.36460  ORF Transcript_8819/g.36460 Transcript_8819/m.36460 type:complete len:390 (-) Transcript_8819:780-1949(-)